MHSDYHVRGMIGMNPVFALSQEILDDHYVRTVVSGGLRQFDVLASAGSLP